MPRDAFGPMPAIFILTCRHSPERRMCNALRQTWELLGDCRVEQIDGMVAEDPGVDALVDARLARWRCKYPLARQEIAVYGTHRLAWQALLEGPHEYALILEDDFHFKDQATVRSAVDSVAALLSDGRHMVKLFDYPRDRSRNRGIERKVAGHRLVKWERTRAGLVGYLLSREGARRLLARPRIFRAVDEDIKFHWELGLDIWSLPGNPIAEISANTGGSLIEHHRRANRRRSITRSLKGMVLTAHRTTLNRWHFRQHLRSKSLMED